MAVKFSQFTSGSVVGDIDFIVGYKSTDNVRIPIGLVTANTTYSISSAQSGSNENITLTGSDASTDSLLVTAGSNITLTDDGAGNGFTIASTATGDTYDLNATTDGSNVDLNLTSGSGTDDSTVQLTAGSNITLTRNSANEVTIAGASGDTYDLNATADGSNVDLNLTSGSGTDNSTVQFTAGTGMTLTRTGAQEITFASSGGGFGSINQFTGTGSSLGALTLGSTPTAAQNCLVSISGVWQNYLDASGAANWTVSTNTFTFVTNPPVTAANGIQIIVIT